MKLYHGIMALGIALGLSQVGMAQAPAGSTGQCKDGSYTSAPKKSGACRGHKGIQTWYAAAGSAAPAAANAPASSPAPASAAAPALAPAATAPASHHHTSTANMAQAPGGGPGMVWVNSSTKVYHCSGTRYYGKTKDGKYMTEAQAKAEGDHPEHGKACGQ